MSSTSYHRRSRGMILHGPKQTWHCIKAFWSEQRHSSSILQTWSQRMFIWDSRFCSFLFSSLSDCMNSELHRLIDRMMALRLSTAFCSAWGMQRATKSFDTETATNSTHPSNFHLLKTATPWELKKKSVNDMPSSQTVRDHFVSHIFCFCSRTQNKPIKSLRT